MCSIIVLIEWCHLSHAWYWMSIIVVIIIYNFTLADWLILFLNRLMTRFILNQTKYTLDSFLSRLSCPLLLLWGDLDPWVGPTKAIRIKEFYPNTSLVSLQAGHCPHDEVPELVNKALINWLLSLKLEASFQTL